MLEIMELEHKRQIKLIGKYTDTVILIMILWEILDYRLSAAVECTRFDVGEDIHFSTGHFVII